MTLLLENHFKWYVILVFTMKSLPYHWSGADTEKYLTVVPHANWPRPSDYARLLYSFSEDIFTISSQIQSNFLIEIVTIF